MTPSRVTNSETMSFLMFMLLLSSDCIIQDLKWSRNILDIMQGTVGENPYYRVVSATLPWNE